MGGPRVLISGIGVAGPTLAYWLQRHGFAPTLVDRAPALRTGGYVVDFWGLGYDVAERMDLVPEIDRVGYRVRELRVVGDSGRRLAGFGVRVFAELTGGRFATLARSDLSRLIFDKIKNGCELIFDDEIVGLSERADRVAVRFRRGGEGEFDLAIGADGLHSGVRKLVFGAEDRFEKPLGYTAAAFEIEGYRPRDEDVYVTYGTPGRQLARFALHGDRTLFLFIFADARESPGTIEGQKTVIREQFANGGWECETIVRRLDDAPELYFDRVSQIRMSQWSRGRVALVGDAAFCVSLMAGQGSALAMAAAYVLAGELANAGGRHEEAFGHYERLLKPFISRKQIGAARFASSFAPRTRAGLMLRNAVLNAFALPGLAKAAFGRDFADPLALPDYPR